jgi:hypothetical protein
MPEFPNMPRHERRKLVRWLAANYPHHLRMMAGLEIPESMIDTMVDFGKALGSTRFNFLRERWQDYSILHFCFKQGTDAEAFQARFSQHLAPDIEGILEPHREESADASRMPM